jgi:hypothetical protein
MYGNISWHLLILSERKLTVVRGLNCIEFGCSRIQSDEKYFNLYKIEAIGISKIILRYETGNVIVSYNNTGQNIIGLSSFKWRNNSNFVFEKS